MITEFITFVCPHCEAIVQASTNDLALSYPCPGCQSIIEKPGFDTLTQADVNALGGLIAEQQQEIRKLAQEFESLRVPVRKHQAIIVKLEAENEQCRADVEAVLPDAEAAALRTRAKKLRQQLVQFEADQQRIRNEADLELSALKSEARRAVTSGIERATDRALENTDDRIREDLTDALAEIADLETESLSLEKMISGQVLANRLLQRRCRRLETKAEAELASFNRQEHTAQALEATVKSLIGKSVREIDAVFNTDFGLDDMASEQEEYELEPPESVDFRRRSKKASPSTAMPFPKRSPTDDWTLEFGDDFLLDLKNEEMHNAY